MREMQGEKYRRPTWKRPPARAILFRLLVLILVPAFCQAAVSSRRAGIRGAPFPPHPENLTRQQCMQCHPVVTGKLRRAGGKHARLDCRQCHRQFHSYFAGKGNYRDILPRCVDCHGLQHGGEEEVTGCSQCHREGHTPRLIAAGPSLERGCGTCHRQPYSDIKTSETKHTELYCSACHHSRHGYIPECLECHQPHTGTVPQAGALQNADHPFSRCLSCHPPHKALQVKYPDSTSNSICTYCHRHAGEMLVKSGTRHARLECVACHPDNHGNIKQCEECHDPKHPKAMLKQKPEFATCGGCHGVAHNVVR